MFDELIISIICKYISYAEWTNMILAFGRSLILPFSDIPYSRINEVSDKMYANIPWKVRWLRYIADEMLPSRELNNATSVNFVTFDLRPSRMLQQWVDKRCVPEPYIKSYLLDIIDKDGDEGRWTASLNCLELISHRMTMPVEYVRHFARFHLPVIFYASCNVNEFLSLIIAIVYEYPTSDIVFRYVMKGFQLVDIIILYGCVAMGVQRHHPSTLADLSKSLEEVCKDLAYRPTFHDDVYARYMMAVNAGAPTCHKDIPCRSGRIAATD